MALCRQKVRVLTGMYKGEIGHYAGWGEFAGKLWRKVKLNNGVSLLITRIGQVEEI